jgi:acyl-coenzyme A thioesterase 13
MADSPELVHVQEVWDRMKLNSPLYSFLLQNVSLVSASNGNVQARLAIETCHLNSKGTLHGCVSASLVDWAGGMAIASTGLSSTGVSTDMHTTLIATARKDDVLNIMAKANKVGSTLAFTGIEIRRAGDEAIIATGTHTKYVKQPK